MDFAWKAQKADVDHCMLPEIPHSESSGTHCANLAADYKAAAAKAREMAQMHEQMAKEAQHR